MYVCWRFREPILIDGSPFYPCKRAGSNSVQKHVSSFLFVYLLQWATYLLKYVTCLTIWRMFRRFFGQGVHYKFYKCTRRCSVRDWLKPKNKKTTTRPHVLFPGLASATFLQFDMVITPISRNNRTISAKPNRSDTCVANTKRSGVCIANTYIITRQTLKNEHHTWPLHMRTLWVRYRL